MIKVRRNTKSQQPYQLEIDGVLIDNKQVFVEGGGVKGKYSYVAYVDNLEISKIIAAYPFSELPASIKELKLNYPINWTEIIDRLWLSRQNKRSSYEIWFNFDRLHLWRGIYSFGEYFDEFYRIAQEARDDNLLLIPGKDDIIENQNDFSAIFSSIPLTSQIANEIERCSNILRSFHEEAMRVLDLRTHNESVVMTFDFPEEIKVPCEQYLLFFARFLRDLGVESETSLTHEAGQVLFSVTPTDKEQALDNIRTALQVYLHLPASPISDVQQSEVAILRLNSELQHFQSQLSLARAEIQMKEAAIQLQRTTIAQLSGEVIIDSVKNVTPQVKSEDKEELIKDVLAVSKFEKGGFQVNLAEVVRKLKRLFNKDEEK